jgi:hypothetical protein
VVESARCLLGQIPCALSKVALDSLQRHMVSSSSSPSIALGTSAHGRQSLVAVLYSDVRHILSCVGMVMSSSSTAIANVQVAAATRLAQHLEQNPELTARQEAVRLLHSLKLPFAFTVCGYPCRRVLGLGALWTCGALAHTTILPFPAQN